MNCIEFNSWDLGSLIAVNTQWSSSFIQSCWSLFEIISGLQLEH